MKENALGIVALYIFVIVIVVWRLLFSAPLPEVVITPQPVVLPFTVVSGPTQVTNTDVFEENWASLCDLDGRLLITRSVMEQGAQFLYRIGALDLEGNFERLSSVGDFQDVKPDWSPDCSRITFERLSGDLTDVYVMELGYPEYSITQGLPENLHAYAPSFSPNGEQIVMTVSDCIDCVPEDTSATTQFGIVTLGDIPSIQMVTRPVGDWGYMSNATFSDDGTALIFNAVVSGTQQIGLVLNIQTETPTYSLLTNDPYNHFMPEWLPGRNDAFIYSGQGNGHMTINLSLNGRSYGLFADVGECKDPDVRGHDGIYTVIATCETSSGVSDFYQMSFTLP